MELDSLLASWLTHTRALIEGVEIFDAHTHLGQNDPDGMKQTPRELMAVLRAAGARGAFTFPMHEPGPEGYPPYNDMVIEAAAHSDGMLIPFCRVSPNAGNATQEAVRALDAGCRGIKLHPRAEQFALDHPAVRELAQIAAERELPILVHAGRGIPALGRHLVELSGAYPSARFILAHAGITDLAWIWKVAPDHPNLTFDTSWWLGPDLQALFTLVPPGQILFASDAPYGDTLVSCVSQLRGMLHAGLSPDQIRLIASGQSRHIAEREPLEALGPAVGEREHAPHILLERVASFTMFGALSMIRGDLDGRGPEMIALARLACLVPDDHDDAPVCAAVDHLLALWEQCHAEDPEARAPRRLLMLAASIAQTPDVPLPPDAANL